MINSAILRLGKVKAILFVTINAVMFSLLVNLGVETLSGKQIDPRAIVMSILTPASIVPFMTWKIFSLIEKLIATQDELHRASITDPLTQVYNRRHFFELLHVEVERLRRYHRWFAILVLDIDHFKQINDRYGHAAGDQVLVSIAKTCRECCRTNDIFARLGGDEFVFLLPETSLEDAQSFAMRICEQVSNLDCSEIGPEASPTMSIGIATFQNPAGSLDDYLKQADNAMYRAKLAGRNQVISTILP
ncbi:MAG TPA: GGDEF domain-containing protein [Anaerolineaceae bacterium]